MRKYQLLLISAAIVLLAGLYIFGQRASGSAEAAKAPAAAPMMGGGKVPAADFPTLLQDAKKPLSPDMQLRISKLENGVVRGSVKADQITMYHALYSLWDSLMQAPIAAHYLGEAAKLENSKKNLTFAANLFLTHLQHTQNEPVRKWEANEATALLQQALKMDEGNDSLKVALGSAYLAGGQVMQGVQQLLAVTESDPGNIAANLTLGRLSVTSGQYDKAVTRMETVLDKDPDNTEALYFLGEAYKALGNKEKAIATFERCKQLVNNPEFSKEIDNYIDSFK